MPVPPTGGTPIDLGATSVLDVLFITGFAALFAAFVLMAGAVEKL